MADQFQHLGAVTVNVLAQVPLRPQYSGIALALARRLARRAVDFRTR
jgi:hypothetical protein